MVSGGERVSFIKAVAPGGSHQLLQLMVSHPGIYGQHTLELINKVGCIGKGRVGGEGMDMIKICCAHA